MEDQDSQPKKPRLRKPPLSQREKAEKERQDLEKVATKRKITSKAKQGAKKSASFLGNEYYLPMPDNRIGRFMNKRRRFIPKYFRESWAELRLVTWPGRKETWRLTLAVFIFAIVFGILVGLVDKGLDILFKDVIVE